MGSNKYQKVNVEDMNFQKRFYIQSKDQVEARYLVTPAFMARFQDLMNIFGVTEAKCSFYNNKIMVAFSTNRNMFEFTELFRPFSDTRMVSRLYNQIVMIYKVIDFLKLDRKTGI